MMLLPHPESLQDSIPVKNIQLRDSASIKSDSASLFKSTLPDDTVKHVIRRKLPEPFVQITDTVSVCRRNSIEDVTFYDSANLVTRIRPHHQDNFPFLFTEKGRIITESRKAALVKHLRAGDQIPGRAVHDDWIIFIILFAAFLFIFIRKSSDSVLHRVERYFLFKGINDPSARDTAGLFTLDSTLKNLISFFILGLFGYNAAVYRNLIPVSQSGILIWIISVLIIVAAVTSRHLVCLLTGAITREREVFMEYINSIYQFYRFSALLIFIVIILMSYTTIFNLERLFTTGIIIIAILYLIRVMRLFIIFINKNISLFYLILYLCALEILPILIFVKYISGLV
jgi:hypothetical protein